MAQDFSCHLPVFLFFLSFDHLLQTTYNKILFAIFLPQTKINFPFDYFHVLLGDVKNNMFSLNYVYLASGFGGLREFFIDFFNYAFLYFHTRFHLFLSFEVILKLVPFKTSKRVIT